MACCGRPRRDAGEQKGREGTCDDGKEPAGKRLLGKTEGQCEY